MSHHISPGDDASLTWQSDLPQALKGSSTAVITTACYVGSTDSSSRVRLHSSAFASVSGVYTQPSTPASAPGPP